MTSFPPISTISSRSCNAPSNVCRCWPKPGIHTFFNGPESFTPDNAYYLGPQPECDNLWVAAGFNSIGIQSAGGAGMALARWMEDGLMPFDLGDVDIARVEPFQRNRHYLQTRVTEVARPALR